MPSSGGGGGAGAGAGVGSGGGECTPGSGMGTGMADNATVLWEGAGDGSGGGLAVTAGPDRGGPPDLEQLRRMARAMLGRGKDTCITSANIGL